VEPGTILFDEACLMNLRAADCALPAIFGERCQD